MTSESSFRRARAIARASVLTLARNPRLLWFPMLAAVGHLGLLALCILAAGLRDWLGADLHAAPLVRLLHGQPGAVHPSATGGVLAYVAFQLISTGAGVALTHGAVEALAGRSWSVSAALQRVRERRAAIAGFAVLRALAGSVLAGRKQRGPRRERVGLLRKLGRAAWWAATYLVLPVLAREDRGPLDSIRRSASLFSHTWREGILGRWTLGWLWLPWIVVCATPVALAGLLGLRSEASWLLVLVACSGGFGLGAVLLGTLDRIYRAALYVFATEGVVPEPFAVDDLETLWETAPTPVDDPSPTSDAPA